MRGWEAQENSKPGSFFLHCFPIHPDKHETKQNWLTDNRQQMYTAHRRSRQLGNIIHKYIHQFMPRDGRIYIIQMEMGFIYNGCLFTGQGGKTNPFLSTGGWANKKHKEFRSLERRYIPMDAPASVVIYIRLLSAAGHLSGRDQARVKTFLGIHVYIKSDRKLERESVIF